MKIERNLAKRVIKVLYLHRREMRSWEISEILGGISTQKISRSIVYLYPKFVKKRYSTGKSRSGRNHTIVYYQIRDNPKLLKSVKEYLSKQDIQI